MSLKTGAASDCSVNIYAKSIASSETSVKVAQFVKNSPKGMKYVKALYFLYYFTYFGPKVVVSDTLKTPNFGCKERQYDSKMSLKWQKSPNLVRPIAVLK